MLSLILVLVGVVIVVVAAVWLRRTHPGSEEKSFLDPSLPQASLQQLVGKVVVVAIPQRRQHIEQALRSFGLSPTGCHFIEPVLKADVRTQPGFRRGQVACYKSHMRALTAFLQDPTAQTALILEDDIEPCSNVSIHRRRVAALQQELQQVREWDVVYLGRCYDNCRKQTQISPQLASGATPLCAHAYLVTRQAASTILQHAWPIRQYLDVQLAKLCRAGKLRCLSVTPSLLQQSNKLVSTIRKRRSLPECKNIELP